MGATSGRQILSVGAKAPSFRLADAAGVEHSLEDWIRTGPVLLVFYKNSCPVCQYTLPFLERVREQGRVPVVAISQDDAAATRRFLEQHGLAYPALVDEARKGYAVSNAFGISAVPSLFQVEPDGAISHAWQGWSKAEMEAFGERTGIPVLREGEQAPALRPG